VARGDAVPGSDVDFLVDFDPDRTVLDLSALILDLQAALGCEVDVKERTRDGRAGERIRREAIAL
jgi:predicted nucleotidyltransferase